MKVVNTDGFTGGKNARDYHTVTKQDTDGAVTSLTPVLYAQALQALQEVKPNYSVLISLPCSTAITTSSRVGQEATSVKVMVAETCTAIAYSQQSLQEKARDTINRVPTGFVLTRVAVHVISSLVGNQEGVTIVVSINVVYNPTVRKGTGK